MNMRLIGARTLQEIVPSMVDTTSLQMHATTVPDDGLYQGNCKPPSILDRGCQLTRFPKTKACDWQRCVRRNPNCKLRSPKSTFILFGCLMFRLVMNVNTRQSPAFPISLSLLEHIFRQSAHTVLDMIRCLYKLTKQKQ